MSTRLMLSCSGCDATATSEPMRRHWDEILKSRTGGSWGRHRIDSIEDVTPEGWVTHDPYTGLTYCPECWASIEDDTEDDR